MNALLIKTYQNSPIPFLSDGWVNATQMAKAFGTRPREFLKHEPAQKYITALKDVLKEEVKTKGLLSPTVPEPDVVRVVYGGKEGEHGTWMHPDLALEFARWLSPHFGIWCNRVMRDVLEGKTVTPQRAAELLPGVAGVRDAVDALWAARFSSGAVTMRLKRIHGTPTQIANAITNITGETHAANWVGRALRNGVGKAKLVRTAAARRYTLTRPN